MIDVGMNTSEKQYFKFLKNMKMAETIFLQRENKNIQEISGFVSNHQIRLVRALILT